MALFESEGKGGVSTSTPEPKRKSGGRSRPAPAPAPAPSSTRFDRTNVTRLTPFEIEVPIELAPEPTQASLPDLGNDTTWKPYSSWSDAFGGSDSQDSKPTERVSDKEPEQKTESKTVKRRSYEMTWEDYQALSEEQRAAVDFNTLLIQAREKDLNSDYDASEQQRKTYDKAVEEMFGEDRGSEVYAPETLSVLRQIDFKSDGEDLDDFLGLKAAISEKELKGFSLERDVPAPLVSETPTTDMASALSPYGAGGLETEQRAAVYTQAGLERAMAQSNQVLADFKNTLAMQRNEDLQFFGGELNEAAKVPLGFGSIEMRKDPNLQGIDEHFRNAFDALSRKENEPFLDQIWAKVLKPDNGAPLNEQEQQALLAYIDTRTRQQTEYGQDRGEGKDKQFQRPAVIRQLVGLETGDSGGDR